MTYRTESGLTLGEAVQAIFRRLADKLNGMGRTISDSLAKTTKEHVKARFPGSDHYSPEKIKPGESQAQPSSARGEVVIDIPGFSRAWHDVTIRPVKAKYLAIPMHSSSFGKKPSDFKDLFTIKGKNALFQKQGSGIVALFALAKGAFQKQDETIAPSDEKLAEGVAQTLFAEIDRLENLGRGI